MSFLGLSTNVDFLRVDFQGLTNGKSAHLVRLIDMETNTTCPGSLKD